MTYLSTETFAMTSAAADVGEIGAAIRTATASAAASTSSVLAAAEDDVSAAIARVFGSYGADCQAVVAQATALHDEFSALLAASGLAYTDAEAVNAATVSASVPAPALAGTTVSLIMGGTGNPIPSERFVDGVLNYITQQYGATSPLPLVTPEQLYPLTGAKSPSLNTSVSQGVTLLDNAILSEIGRGNSVVVGGYSQSAIIASLEMRHLATMPGAPGTDRLSFLLLANPMNPNGGLLARFAGLTLPSLGLDFFGATPSDTRYQTAIYSYEYDGFADFPRYPINIVSDLNAIAGIAVVHSKTPYLNIQSLPPGDAVQLGTSDGYSGNTTYYMIRNHELPLLAPLRAIPLVGDTFADLIEPDLRTIVNLGYGDPRYGYSTTAADIPTPFGLFPAVDPVLLSSSLITGTQHGIATATADLTAPSPAVQPDLSALGLFSGSDRLLPPPAEIFAIPTSQPGFIEQLQAANSYVVDTFTRLSSRAYGILLPTADILAAGVTTIPSYNLNLFLDGVDQFASGDPLGLVRAVGYPIAADTALVTTGLGVEALVLMNAVVKGF